MAAALVGHCDATATDTFCAALRERSQARRISLQTALDREALASRAQTAALADTCDRVKMQDRTRETRDESAHLRAVVAARARLLSRLQAKSAAAASGEVPENQSGLMLEYAQHASFVALIERFASDLSHAESYAQDLAWLRSLEPELSSGTLQTELATGKDELESVLAQQQRFFESLCSLEDALVNQLA